MLGEAASSESCETALSRNLQARNATPFFDNDATMGSRPEDFISGPLPVRRDSAARLGVGFTVRDGHYLSARWPGDAHRFASEFAAMIG